MDKPETQSQAVEITAEAEIPKKQVSEALRGRIGRPPRDVTERAKSWGNQALEVLGKLLTSRKEGMRYKAACALLDRGYGKPVSSIEMRLRAEEGRPAHEIPTSELEAIIAAHLQAKRSVDKPGDNTQSASVLQDAEQQKRLSH